MELDRTARRKEIVPRDAAGNDGWATLAFLTVYQIQRMEFVSIFAYLQTRAYGIERSSGQIDHGRTHDSDFGCERRPTRHAAVYVAKCQHLRRLMGYRLPKMRDPQRSSGRGIVSIECVDAIMHCRHEHNAVSAFSWESKIRN